MSQARLTIRELQQLKWLLGGVLALLSFWALSSLDAGGEWILACASLLSLAVLVAPRFGAKIPPLTWRIATPLLILIVGMDFISSVPDFVPALVRMVVYLLAYRVLAPRARRDDLQLILLCLFCLVIAGVLTVSVLFAVRIILFTPVAMGLLFVINLLDQEAQHQSGPDLWEGFSWGHLIQRVWRVLDLKVLSIGAVLFGLIVAFSTLIFVLTPRIDLQQAIPMMQMRAQAQSGFSEEVSIGSVSDIMQDDSVAFRVDVPSFEAIDPVPYWRMLILDQYREGRFRMSPILQSRVFRKTRKAQEVSGWGEPVKGRAGEYWTFYFEGGISKYLPVPGPYELLRFQGMQDVSLTPELYLVNLDSVKQSVLFYQIKDLRWGDRFPASEREMDAFADSESANNGDSGLEEAGPRYPLTALELDIPSDDEAYLSDVVENVRTSVFSSDAGVFARGASRYLMENYRYSLSPDGESGEGDPIVRWLRTGTRGHCEYFAGSLVLILREAGYPARLVVGFSGGNWNSVEDYFVARNSDAHAWVEVYDAGSGDWLRIDPTPGAGTSQGVAAPSRTSVDYEGGWMAWTDSLRIQWYRRIVNFDQDSQAELFATLKTTVQGTFNNFKSRANRIGRNLLAWIRQPWGMDRLGDWGYLFVGFALSAVLWWKRSAIDAFLRRMFRRPPKKDPVRHRAGCLLVRMKEARAVLGEEAGFDAGRWRELKQQLDRLRYGPAEGRESSADVFAAVRRFLRR